MNAAQVKTAAKLALTRYLAAQRTETSTRDFTAVVYPDLESIIVQWVIERKDGTIIEKNRVFAITLALK